MGRHVFSVNACWAAIVSDKVITTSGHHRQLLYRRPFVCRPQSLQAPRSFYPVDCFTEHCTCHLSPMLPAQNTPGEEKKSVQPSNSVKYTLWLQTISTRNASIIVRPYFNWIKAQPRAITMCSRHIYWIFLAVDDVFPFMHNYCVQYLNSENDFCTLPVHEIDQNLGQGSYLIQNWPKLHWVTTISHIRTQLPAARASNEVSNPEDPSGNGIPMYETLSNYSHHSHQGNHGHNSAVN